MWFIQQQKSESYLPRCPPSLPLFSPNTANKYLRTFCVPRGTLGTRFGNFRNHKGWCCFSHGRPQKVIKKSHWSTSCCLPPELEAPLVCVSSSVQRGVPNMKRIEKGEWWRNCKISDQYQSFHDCKHDSYLTFCYILSSFFVPFLSKGSFRNLRTWWNFTHLAFERAGEKQMKGLGFDFRWFPALPVGVLASDSILYLVFRRAPIWRFGASVWIIDQAQQEI